MAPRLQWRSVLPFVQLLVGATACQSLVGDYEPDLEILENTVAPAELCAAESRFAVPVALGSDDHEPSLEAYYAIANPTLVARLSEVEQILHQGQPHRGATYIWGAAGVGKSYVTDNAFAAFAASEKCELDLKEVFTGPAASVGFATTSNADLKTVDGSVVFNELPSLATPADFVLEVLLEAAGCVDGSAMRPLIILDGLDELHDDTARAILREVDRLLLGGGDLVGSFLHFVVAGRADGFASWLGDPARSEVAGVELFELQPPKYDSAGDIEFRVVEYLAYIGELAGLEAQGGVDSYVRSVQSALAAHPFLTYTLGNLGLGNFVIEHTRPNLDETEEELKAGLFDDILSRNAKSHGRPGGGSEYEQPYLRLLEDIAARYAEESESGRFVVRSSDEVTVEDDDGHPLGMVRVRDVLNHGGVSVPDSATASTTRMRFEPLWLHAHLVERRNHRFDSHYTYSGCE